MAKTTQNFHFERAIAFWLAVILMACQTAADNTQKEMARILIETTSGEVEVHAELADTDEKRQRGLMHRTHLAENSGMFFIFDHADRVMFWMRDTPLPLDMIFISADQKILHIEEKTVPLSTEIITSPREVKYVLEVPADFCEKNGVRAGDTVQIN